MKRCSDGQIASALRQAEDGILVEETCRMLGVSEPTFSRWKKQFVGTGTLEISRLKRPVADLSLDKTMLQDVLRK